MTDNTESFRAECEARWCLSLGEEDRRAYYAAVLSHRGKGAANRLIEAVNAERRIRNDPNIR